MVKADNKHNYYADLELPTTCSIEEIKKQYRKLALQYHPDRNAGKEEEYVPKFQAIQTAHEILGDAAQKQRYDADRRKAGLYPTFRPSQAPTGNPYTATSAYPPPPRRTQPGTYSRPQPSAGASATPSGADRFAQFPRGAAPTARKEPAPDRANMFRAWENLNNAQSRQRAPPAAAQHTPSRARPPPPPRPESRMPSEEEIRAGVNYRKGPGHSDQQSAYSAFQEGSAPKPNLGRSRTTRTPRKQGFDPNLPGSDERPAGQGHYVHRHKSADFGTPTDTPQPGHDGSSFPFPPPPPGPPPHSPMSPSSPTGAGPHNFADPLKPFKTRTMDEEVPYAEGNRVRTPYTKMSGEKTELSDGLRRSASVRDACHYNTQNPSASRARSTSPLHRQSNPKSNSSSKKLPTSNSNSSEESVLGDDDFTEPPETFDSRSGTPLDPGRHESAAPQAAPVTRRKKVPTPPSQRFNSSTHPFNAPSPSDGVQSDGEKPGMQQKTGNTMYASSTFFNVPITPLPPPFDAAQWATQMFGSPSANKSGQRSQGGIPSWAVPSSVLPRKEKKLPANMSEFLEHRDDLSSYPHPSDEEFKRAVGTQKFAYINFRADLLKLYGCVPDNLNMHVFLKLASTAASGQSTGKPALDEALSRTLSTYSSIINQHRETRTTTDGNFSPRFNFSINPDTFTPANGKSRSEESINTSFSPEGFSGHFTGTPDYFPPQPKSKAASPSRRTTQRSGVRSATSSTPLANGHPAEEAPPPPSQHRPAGLDGEDMVQSKPVKFSTQEWEKTFQDPSWSWPAPPPNPPGFTKTGTRPKPGSRKPSSKSSVKSAGTKQDPYVPRDDGTYDFDSQNSKGENGAAPTVDGDAMDIDTPPPAQAGEPPPPTVPTHAEDPKGPRLYNVPPSPWRQQQQTQANIHRKAASASHVGPGAKLKTSLDDLANVEPLAHSADGLKSFGGMASEIPFHSQASPAISSQHTEQPAQQQSFQVPIAPKTPVRLTKESWRQHTQSFAAYLSAYHVYNTKALRDLASREEKAQVLLSGGASWLEATGDTMGANQQAPGTFTGFSTYHIAVREEKEVRERWELVYERHVDAVGEFEKTREKLREMAVRGSLVDR